MSAPNRAGRALPAHPGETRAARCRPASQARLPCRATTRPHVRHMQDVDKEAQLSQALISDNPVTDLPIAVEVDYFRLEKHKYFVPISSKVPGSALSFRSKRRQAGDGTRLHRRSLRRAQPVGCHRSRHHPAQGRSDITPAQVAQKSIQYDTGVTLDARQIQAAIRRARKRRGQDRHL